MKYSRRQAATPQAVQKCHDLIVWLVPQLDKMPRQRRYTLGERLENALLEVLELLVGAAYSSTKSKSTQLSRANSKLDVARHLWRMAMELHAVAQKSWHYGASLMLELGQQIGGWVKSLGGTHTASQTSPGKG